MAKKIDLSKSVYELTKAYPELIEIMAELGFTEITKKAVSLLSFLPLGKGSKARLGEDDSVSSYLTKHIKPTR